MKSDPKPFSFHRCIYVGGRPGFANSTKANSWRVMKTKVIPLLLSLIVVLTMACTREVPAVVEKEVVVTATPDPTRPSLARGTPSPNTPSPAYKNIVPAVTTEPATVAPTQGPTSAPLAQPADLEVLFNPEEYDVQCMDQALGMNITNEIVHMGRTPTDAEMVQIEQCLIRAETATPPKDETKPATGLGTTFDLDNFRPECIVETLGGELAAQIRFGGRIPTASELYQLKRCSLKVTQDSSGKNIMPADFDSPVLRNVAKPLLPEGVLAAELKSVKLPKPSRVKPNTDQCEIFEDSRCAELRWVPVNDLRAGSFTSIKISPVDPDVIFAGVDSNDMSLYKSDDAGETWKLVHITGHTSGIAVNPNDPDVVVYSILEGPMHRSSDGGDTWLPVDTGSVRIQRSDPASVGANIFTTVVFAPGNGRIAYAATVDGMHRSGTDRGPINLFASRNEGATWELAGTCPTCGGIKSLAVDPRDHEVVWAATNNGVQLSRDGGKTWSGNLIEDLVHRSETYGVALQPGNPDTVLLASAESGMFRSSDGGATWSAVNIGLGTRELHEVTFAPSNSNVAYVASHEGVYRSADAGQTWQARSRGLGYLFTTPIAVDPRDEDILYVGSASEVYTTHPVHFHAGLHEGEGLYKSIDGGRNWYRSDVGIDEAKLVQMSTHPLLPFNLWAAGESGRGAFFSPDAGGTWLFSPNHAAHYPMVFAFSRSFPTTIALTSWQNDGELMSSVDGAYNWIDLTPRVAAGISEETKALGLYDDEKRRWLHLHGLAISEADEDIIYVGSVHDTVYPNVDFNLKGAHIFKSVDGGVTFKEISNGFPIETHTSINAIVVNPTDPDIAYAMTTLHETETAIGIYKTIDGGENWSPVNDGLDLHTNDLQMDRSDPNTLYAATESGIFKTTNAGLKWRFSSIGIPDKTPVIDLAIDPINPLYLYAITPDHVYRSKNGGTHWYVVDLGIELVPKQQLASAQARQLDRTKTGHSVYGSTFAQDRTLEIDATGRVVYVVAKTKSSDRYGPQWDKVRKLYRAVLPPFILVEYQFEINGERLVIQSSSHIYDVVFDENVQEIRFTSAAPQGVYGQVSINIPRSLQSDSYEVSIDGGPIRSSSTVTSLSFTNDRSGRNLVAIKLN